MSTSKEAQVESKSAFQEPGRPASARQRTPYILLLVGFVRILGGGLIANITQTVGGQVAVRQVNFAGTNGVLMSGLLYIPNLATSATPACGVVTIHGYINSYDTMDGYSIEMARRGCVVLAVNQTGHSASHPPAFFNGHRGPGAPAYLNSLPTVPAEGIVPIRHSHSASRVLLPP